MTSGVSFVAHVVVAAALVLPSLLPKHLPKPDLSIDPPPQNSGETFELPAPETAEVPLANASPSPELTAPSAPIELPDGPGAPEPPRRGRPATRPSHEGRPSAGRAAAASKEEASPGSTGSSALYGAVGDRSAADLSKAFTRDFPQAASGDPIWRSAALGDAGSATVTLTLDESGHITDVQIAGPASAALTQGIHRTMILMKSRPFTARSKVTKLRIAATINADAVHDGLHGDVFAIGAGDGDAFFALNIGRRVDVRVLAQVGGRVTLAVTASLLVLLAIAVLLIRGLGIG